MTESTKVGKRHESDSEVQYGKLGNFSHDEWENSGSESSDEDSFVPNYTSFNIKAPLIKKRERELRRVGSKSSIGVMSYRMKRAKHKTLTGKNRLSVRGSGNISCGSADADQAGRLRRVCAYCICREMKLSRILSYLRTRPDRSKDSAKALGLPYWRDTLYAGVLHCSTRELSRTSTAVATVPSYTSNFADGIYSDDDEQSQFDPKGGIDVFIFRFGCVVIWSADDANAEAPILASLERFTVVPVTDQELAESSDDMYFCAGDASANAPRINRDTIVLSHRSAIEEMIALSFALAQSSKLFVYEDQVDKTILKTRHIPIELAECGTIKLTQKDINKMIGRLFMQRAEVNLHSDILDTPDYFWEADRYEPLYKKALTYLDLPVRLEILNRRLDIIGELLDVLHTQVENKHASKLEWIIIWLIVVEVALELLWDVVMQGFLKL